MKKVKDLAKVLVNTTQLPYQWFEYGSLLLVNVSLTRDPNHYQEYHVYKRDVETKKYYLFDSIIVNAMNENQLSKWLIEQDNKNIDNMKAITREIPLRDSNETVYSVETIESYKQRFNQIAASF